MHTFSGDLTWFGRGPHPWLPTPADIGAGLATKARWGGDMVPLRETFSVAHHTLAGDDVLLLMGASLLHRVQWLLHDAEEMVTTDVRRPFKTPEQRAEGARLRGRIYNHYGVPVPDSSLGTWLNNHDEAMAEGEAEVLVHPRYRRAHFPPAQLLVVDAVWTWIDVPAREAAQTYTERLTQALEELDATN